MQCRTRIPTSLYTVKAPKKKTLFQKFCFWLPIHRSTIASASARISRNWLQVYHNKLKFLRNLMIAGFLFQRHLFFNNTKVITGWKEEFSLHTIRLRIITIKLFYSKRFFSGQAHNRTLWGCWRDHDTISLLSWTFFLKNSWYRVFSSSSWW